MPIYNPNTAPSVILTVTSKTTTYTATTSDDVILVDTSGGAWTLTLYAASGNSGKVLTIKKTTSDFSALTIDANDSETIDGQATTTVNTQFEALKIICDGTNWHILERKIDNSWNQYTPTLSGFGTATNVAFFWKRDGDSIDIRGAFTSGTSTAVTAQFSLPPGMTGSSSSSIISTAVANIAGFGALSTSGDLIIFHFGSGATTLVFGRQGTSSTGLNAFNGDQVATATQNVSFLVKGVPIDTWKAN